MQHALDVVVLCVLCDPARLLQESLLMLPDVELGIRQDNHRITLIHRFRSILARLGRRKSRERD